MRLVQALKKRLVAKERPMSIRRNQKSNKHLRLKRKASITLQLYKILSHSQLIVDRMSNSNFLEHLRTKRHKNFLLWSIET